MQISADEVQLPVVHASLRADFVCELRDCRNLASQQHGLKAVLVVQMRVHRRNRQVVVLVLQSSQTFPKLPLVVVEHVRKAGHAVLRRSSTHSGLAKLRSQQIANGFRPVAVAVFCDPVIELLGEPVIERNGEAIHGSGSVA